MAMSRNRLVPASSWRKSMNCCREERSLRGKSLVLLLAGPPRGRSRLWNDPNQSAASNIGVRERSPGDRYMRDPPLILAVDDTPENLEILRVRLEAQGYEVIEAGDGEDGLAKARELKPDLILLDVMMPKIDGIEVVRQLKADAGLRSIPVILVTAKADTKDVVQGLDAGGDDYLTKPFEHSALLARVRSMLRQKALTDTVHEQARQLADWNAALEERVAAQVREIERIGRLRRFLPPQIADLVVSASDGDAILQSHR